VDTSFTMSILFLHKVSFSINTLISSLREKLYGCRLKFFAEASELFMYSVSTSRRPQNSVLGVHLLGGQKHGSRRVLNRECSEDNRKHSTPMLNMPFLCGDSCAVWRCHAEGGLASSSCLAEPFEFRVLTSLMSAHIAVKWCGTSLKEFH
jgi:hypothetical protein